MSIEHRPISPLRQRMIEDIGTAAVQEPELDECPFSKSATFTTSSMMPVLKGRTSPRRGRASETESMSSTTRR